MKAQEAMITSVTGTDVQIMPDAVEKANPTSRQIEPEFEERRTEKISKGRLRYLKRGSRSSKVKWERRAKVRARYSSNRKARWRFGAISPARQALHVAGQGCGDSALGRGWGSLQGLESDPIAVLLAKS